MSSLTANFDPDAATMAVQPTTATLRRGPSIFFKESARMLEKIFEFLYLGQIDALEETTSNIKEADYVVWMFLLTWCVHCSWYPALRFVCRTQYLHLRL